MKPLSRSRRSGLALLLVSLFISAALWAQRPPEKNSQVSDAVIAQKKLLKEEAEGIAKEVSELEAWRSKIPSGPTKKITRPVQQAEVELARLEVETRKVELESIELDNVAAKQSLQELVKAVEMLEEQVQTLAAVPKKATEKNVETKAILAEKRALKGFAQIHIENLLYRKKLAQERLSLAEQWWTLLQDSYQSQQEQTRQQTLEELEQQLAAERLQRQKAAAELRVQVSRFREDPAVSQAKRDLTEAQLLEAEESLFLIDIRLKLAQGRIQLEKEAQGTQKLPREPRVMKVSIGNLDRLKNHLDSLLVLINNKRTLLQQRLEVIEKRRNLDTENQGVYRNAHTVLTQLISSFEKQADELIKLGQAVRAHASIIESTYLEQKKRGLSQRHRFPRGMDQWQPLLSELKRLPAVALQVGRNTMLAFWSAMQEADAGTWSLLMVLGLVSLALFRLLGRLSRHAKQPESKLSFTQKTLIVATSLLRANRLSLLLGSMLIIAALLLDITPPGLAVISSLIGIWLGASLTIGLSRLILRSPVGLTIQQPGLHRLIVIFSILTSLCSLGLVLGYLGFLSSPMRDLVDRAFMLLLLPPVYLALRLRTLLFEMPRAQKVSVYWTRLLSIGGFAIPLAILVAALLGISGYINLAWVVAGYLLLFIAVVAVWMIARGVVMDLARTIEAKLTRRSDKNRFWIKGLVEPLHYLLRLILFLGAAWVLYRLVSGDPTTGLELKRWLNYPLFTFGDTAIDSLNLLGTLLLLVLVFYIGRWSREITYGWLYGGIRDLGIRNSLSVFTQYAVIVVGLLVTLNILGINLTSLTVFAGALGVGIGFGLQNIANNFISGIILLAERPVRTRDWVTIGDKEGEVSQIGMRSVTVTTWDNQDVIIPNSDLISNAFINWTRSNSIVRTVLNIGISYQDDPHQALTVIEEAVTMQPEVSLSPPPRVWLSAFGASSVDFWVHYYVDVGQFRRLEVKSKVMFAIWDAFKEAGIGIPFPQQDIYIKELPNNQVESKYSSP